MDCNKKEVDEKEEMNVIKKTEEADGIEIKDEKMIDKLAAACTNKEGEDDKKDDVLEQVAEEKLKRKDSFDNEKNDDELGDSSEEMAVEGDGEGRADGNSGDEECLDEDKEKDPACSPSERSDAEGDESAVEESQPEIKEEECVQSLLCEETIPGSPAPSTNKDREQETTDSNVVLTLNTAAELPFASAPGSSLHSSTPAYTKPVVAPQPIPSPVHPPPEAAPVMDNTPPTTPESSFSPISNSPRW